MRHAPILLFMLLATTVFRPDPALAAPPPPREGGSGGDSGDAGLAKAGLAKAPEAPGAPGTPSPSRPPRPPDTDPHVELITMGQSPDVYHRFGHAALCLVHHAQPDDTRCYNYGSTDFQAPAHEIGWAFLRGTARFWVAVHSYELMLWAYREDDRDIFIQRIPFTQAQVNRLAARLEHDAREENRYYLYHHFYDNCATRLRDHLNAVSGGALWWRSERGIGLTFRDIGARGLAGRTTILAGATFLLGRRLDQEVTVWHSMFHPDYLRAEVAKRLDAPPEQIYARRGPPVPSEGPSGLGWIALFALVLALPLALVRGISCLRPLCHLALFERLALVLPALVLTLLALVLHAVVGVSALPEARWNEAALFFWEADLALVILGPRRRRAYARVRLAALGLFALALCVGLFRQPLWVPLLLPALPAALVAFDWGKGAPHPVSPASPEESPPSDSLVAVQDVPAVQDIQEEQ